MDTAAALRDPDPVRRLAAIAAVRFRDLKDPAVLAAILDVCRDPTEAPGAPSTGDPFGAFFTDRAVGATVGDLAAERLAKTGLPADPTSVETIRAALETDDAAGRLPSVIARALGETRWQDVPGALRALVPALDRHDEPLFQAIVALPSATIPILASLAAHPLRMRLLQELLNHPPARPVVVDAVEQAFRDHPPAEDQAAAVLAVLSAWADPAVVRIAAGLADRFRWVVAWQALEDPTALPALEAWLADRPEPALLARVSEVLRQRELPDGFPLAAWLHAAGAEHGLARTFGVDDAVAEVLGDWVRDLVDQVGPPERGWTAVSLVVGRHEPLLDTLAEAVAVRDPEWSAPWDRALLEVLARAAPPIDGVPELLLDGLRTNADQAAVAVPALLVLGDEVVRSAAVLLLDLAESADIGIDRLGRGTVREVRRGVDTEAVVPLVERIRDPALAARLGAVLPVVRAG